MAKKDEAGLLEQHLEKMVLAVAAVALVIVGYAYLSASPPDVDGALLRQAKDCERHVVNDPPSSEEPGDYPAHLTRLRERPYDLERVAGELVELTAGRPPVKELTTKPTPKGSLKLADLLPLPVPDRPEVNIDSEVQVLQVIPPAPAGGMAVAAGPTRKAVEVVAAHGAVAWQFSKILDKWRPVLENASLPPIFMTVSVEVQRRQLLPDGRWSDPIGVPPPVLDDPLPTIPAYDGNNLELVRDYIRVYQQPGAQQDVLEPPYPDIVWPDRSLGTWMRNKPRTAVSDMQTEGPAAAPVLEPTYQPHLSPTRVPSSRPIPRGWEEYNPERRGPIYRPPAIPPTKYPTGETARPPAIPPTKGPAGETARPPAIPPTKGPAGETGRLPTGETPATPPRAPVVHAPVVPVGSAAGGGGGLQPLPLVPAINQQLENPKGLVEVWFHDTDNLHMGQSYQYCYRVSLVNPLFGRFSDVAGEQDAKRVALTTEWSPWSATVTVSRPTEFFVVGHFAETDTVNVEVFTKKGGQRVSHTFKVTRGQPVGGVVNMELPPLLGDAPEPVAVDFSTGALAVDFDFNRKLPLPGKNFTRATAEVVYVDAEGKLRSRIEDDDKESAQLKKLRAEVQQSRAGGASRGP